jgi:hypothetical protein
MNTIFVSISSLADTEFLPTIKDLCEKADHPENITISVFLQDEKCLRDKVLKITNKFGTKLKYEYVYLDQAKGVGHARFQTQKHLLPKVHKYYLQVDSHTRFIDSWDTEIIKKYELSKSHFGKLIYSVYPNNYDCRDKKYFLNITKIPTSMQILQDKEKDSPSRYAGRPWPYKGDEFGEIKNYFCGGFAFGDSEIFYKYKYSPKILYNGEEPYMSIKLYADNIKIVVPPQDFVFHDYMGVFQNRRFSFFMEQDNPKYKKYKKMFADKLDGFVDVSYKFLDDFFEGIEDGVFDQKIYDAHLEWFKKFVIPREEYDLSEIPVFE